MLRNTFTKFISFTEQTLMREILGSSLLELEELDKVLYVWVQQMTTFSGISSLGATDPRAASTRSHGTFPKSNRTVFSISTSLQGTLFWLSHRWQEIFLAIPAMSASSERIFSNVGDMVTRKRNRLQPGTIKMLAILKARDLVVDEESTVCDVAEGAKSTSDNIIDKENEKQDEDGEVEAITIEDSDTSEDEDEALVTVFIPEN
ncbi:hypothetical protein OXX79_001421 [Metschnikowia pulcherrima]